MKITLPLLCFLFVNTLLTAQPVRTSEDILKQGLELQKEKKPGEAIQLYKLIPVNDSNYYAGLYEITNCYYADSQLNKALETCKLGLAEPNSEKPSFYNLAGNILDDMGQQQKAITYYDSALVIYPSYITPYLNKATVLFKQKKYQEAESFLQKAALTFPFNSNIHYKLGIAAINQGKMIESFLSLSHSAFVEPGGGNLKNAVAILSEMAKGSDDMMSYYNNRKSEPSENYNLVEQLFVSKAALDKKFKLSTAIEDAITRQMQMIIEKLEYSEEDHDFYVQYYLPVLKNLLNEKQFDSYCNYMFSGLDIKEIRDYNQKHKKEISAMVNTVVNYYHPLRSSRELLVNKRNEDAIYHYENNICVAKGKYVNEQPVGDWEFYYANGNIKSKGRYDDEGKRLGEWLYYYETSQLSGRENYAKGELNGADTEYDPNGTITSASTYVNGLKQGENHDYFANGNLKSIEVFADGKESGILRYYHNSGGVKAEIHAKDGVTHGDFSRFYENGRVETIGRFEDGKQEGKFQFFHENGNISSEGEYAGDQQTGIWKSYHENGKLKSEQLYVNGEPEGEYTEYYDNGQLYYKKQFKKGKIDGEINYYNREGKLFCSMKFVNGKMRETKYFDYAGNVIDQTEAKGKPFDITSWRLDGTKKSETHYNEKGNADGKEVVYWGNGNVYSVTNYKDGQLDGLCAFYFTNGKKEQELKYENGSKNGAFREYYKHGQLFTEGWYKDDLHEGQWVYFDESGAITEKTFYTEGRKNGIRETYYPNGKIEFREEYILNSLINTTQYDSSGNVISNSVFKQGKGRFTNKHQNCVNNAAGTLQNGYLHGKYNSAYFNGNPSTYEFYYRGFPDSTYQRYYLNGRKQQEGRYYRGEKNGIWNTYYENGALYSTEEYSMGKLHGIKTYYHENGKTENEIPYFYGKKEGWQNRYNEDGELMISIRYYEEMPLEYTYNGSDNKTVTPISIKGGTGKIKSFYPNGQLAVEMELSHGDYAGEIKYYHSNGQLTWQSTEDYDMTEGLARKFYASGKPHGEYIYWHNSLHGPSKEWHPNGNLSEEGSYHLGYRHGEWKKYDNNGQLMEISQYYYGRLTNLKKP